MATITGSPADSVFFTRESDQLVMAAKGSKDNQRQLLVTGDGDRVDDHLYAWYRQITTSTSKNEDNRDTTISTTKYYKAGEMGLISYDKIEKDLCLVSVNGATVPEASFVQQELNKIYAQSVTSWNVSTLEGGLTVALSNADQTVLDNTSASDNMTYSDEEKLLVKAMKKNDAYDKNTIYLFFLASGKDASMNGYMPFKSLFGFIFKNKQNPDELMRTIAHESAHGPFRLRHTFSPENKYVQTQGTTDNLMDYVNSDKALTARNLYKYQWDYIHNPETMLFTLWESKEEAEAVGSVGEISLKVIAKAKELTNNLGNVFAVIHCFKLDKKTPNANANIPLPSFSHSDFKSVGAQSFLSESDNIKCNVLFFKFTNTQVEGKSIDASSFLLEQIKEAFKIETEAPFLVVVNPETKHYKDCTSCIGNLDAEARNSITSNSYETYYNDLLSAVKKCVVKHTLLFVSGYRFAIPENENTTDMIYPNDVVDNGKPYWAGIDEFFKSRLKADNVYYADGHMKIFTSNHRTLENFVCSASGIVKFSTNYLEDGLKIVGPMLEVTIGLSKFDMPLTPYSNGFNCITAPHLNTLPNKEGFDIRSGRGELAGDKLLKEMQANDYIDKDNNGKIIDTLDIVCHSMGYAYAVGMIKKLKDQVPFGRFYIIAPENAESGGGIDILNNFTEVWQYGCNEKEKPYDIAKQDGIAPQTPVSGIGILPTEKTNGGRAYIPNDGSVPRGFLSSHQIKNYLWIFDLKPHVQNDNGYVTPR